MKLHVKYKPVTFFCLFVLLAVFTGGCMDEGKLNTEEVRYTPEERPLDVIAGDGAEFAPGDTVVLGGRLVGTVTNETVIWEQTAGTSVEAEDWTAPQLTFEAPVVNGIETFTFRITALDGDGNPIEREGGEPMMDEVSITIFDPEILQTHEVEDASVAEAISVAIVSQGADQFINGASGGAHTADLTPGASVRFTLNLTADQAGFYTLFVRYAIPGSYGGKVGQANVNGVVTDMDLTASGSWESYRVGIIQLNEGSNTIEIGGGWNYYRIDNISLIPSAAPTGPLGIPLKLTNENASDATWDLMEFLIANYGSGTLTGQTEFMNYADSAQTGLREFDKIVAATGDDAPAIVAFDLMDYSSSRIACGATPGTLSEDMITEHNEKNIILSALWHWNAPMHLNDGDCSGDADDDEEQAWWYGFYTRATTFDLAAVLADTGSDEYQALLSDIDAIAVELQKFEDAGIPILFRPLHEAEGGWFWWGAADAESLKQLWALLYERLTDNYDLDNLIWVFTHAGSLDANWYPGDEYVDIVGYDGYDGNNADNPFSSQYNTLKNRHNGSKLVALTETGTIPNVELMHESNAWWSFFITWNSGGDYGPDGADPTDIDMFYAYEGSLNLVDVPGGRTPVEAGLYESFEPSTGNWGAQVNWADTDGLTTTTEWAASGTAALSITKDITGIDAPGNVVFQTYPEGGISVLDQISIEITVNAVNAGDSVNAHIFFKAAESVESWPDPVAIVDGATVLTLSLTDLPDATPIALETLDGLGVRFQGLDTAATAAQFMIDKVALINGDGVETVIYDFEPEPPNWGAQIGWSDTSGMTTSTEWANSGARALALYKDLAAHGSASDIVFQTYPEGGINVAGQETLTIHANAINAGAAVDAHIFFKAPNNVESWPAAVAVTPDGIELTLSLTQLPDGTPITLETLDGLGVRFNGVDASSNDAAFFIDTVTVTNGEGSRVLYDFEGTGQWEFQVEWAGAPGLHLSNQWAADGNYSLSAITQLDAGDNNIVFQSYPAGGILLGEVTTMKITAYAVDAGPNTNAHIFWKSPGGDESWPEPVAVTASGVELTIDVSAVSELSGFGVRFQGADNLSTESQFFIDNIIFE